MIKFSLLRSIIIFRKIKNRNINKNKKFILMPNENSISELLSILPLYLSVANAGYRIKIYLSLRDIRIIFLYLLFGIKDFYFISTKSFKKKSKNENNFKLKIDKFIDATLMRHYKVESIENLPKNIKSKLVTSCKAILNGLVKKDFKNVYAVFFTDYHYIPQGLIKSYLEKYNKNINLFDYHVGHKNSTLIINQLNNVTLARHPFSPPLNEFNEEINNISKKDARIRIKNIQSKLISFYEKSSWYEVCRTSSFIKNKYISKRDLLKNTDYDKYTKVFSVFPHIYFDTSAFSGKDIYRNYRVWFEKTIKFILKKTNSILIIKDHPANLQKYAYNNQEYKSPIKFFLNSLDKKYQRRFLYLPPSTEISALNVIKLSDCVLTVRGTIGVEASLFGKPVIFAGEGRFNGYGFGYFPKRIKEFHELLLEFSLNKKELSQSEKLNAATYLDILWEQMTYYSKIISVNYPKDPNKKIITYLNTNNIKIVLEDIKGISDWIRNPKECYLSKNTELLS